MSEDLYKRLRELGLLGLAARLDELGGEPWLERVIAIEHEERQHRGLDRRLKNSRLGRFKPMADYDWSWPKVVDREAIEDLFRLAFVEEGANIVIVGPNGTGKTMVAKNLAHAVIRSGKSARFITASAMLTELAAQDGVAALRRAFRRYTSPAVLIIDELGYVAYANRHADVLFEVVNRRYESGRSIVVTTNRSFQDWGELFPNATCVVPLVDRLVHRSEIIEIDGESYRLKEAQERPRKKKRVRLLWDDAHAASRSSLSAGVSLGTVMGGFSCS